jgi:hypothetical protein
MEDVKPGRRCVAVTAEWIRQHLIAEGHLPDDAVFVGFTLLPHLQPDVVAPVWQSDHRHWSLNPAFSGEGSVVESELILSTREVGPYGRDNYA